MESIWNQSICGFLALIYTVLSWFGGRGCTLELLHLNGEVYRKFCCGCFLQSEPEWRRIASYLLLLVYGKKTKLSLSTNLFWGPMMPRHRVWPAGEDMNKVLPPWVHNQLRRTALLKIINNVTVTILHVLKLSNPLCWHEQRRLLRRKCRLSWALNEQMHGSKMHRTLYNYSPSLKFHWNNDQSTHFENSKQV